MVLVTKRIWLRPSWLRGRLSVKGGEGGLADCSVAGFLHSWRNGGICGCSLVEE